MRHKGFFVVIEGMDGTGKTFLTNRIHKSLLAKGFNAIHTREPGGDEGAEAIRNVIFSEIGDKLCVKAETLLFLASRAQNVENMIKPNLDKGKIVLCDRYNISTIVYQGRIKQQKELEKIRNILNYATSGITPNLTIFMKAKAIDAFNRRKKNSYNRYDKNVLGFFKQVEQEYNKEISLFNNNNAVLVLDSNLSLDILTVKSVNKIINMLG